MTGKRIGWWLALLCGVVLVGVAAAGAAAPSQKAESEARTIVFSGGSWLGVQISDLTAERATELKLPGLDGAEIVGVEDDSPAAKAGLQQKDVIVSFAGERVRSAAQLGRLVRETPADRKVSVQVVRAGQTRSVEVTLERQHGRVLGRHIQIPEIRVPRIEIPEIHIFSRRPRLGISGDELTPQLADYFGVKQGKGVLVREVVAESAAAKAGLKAGDVIIRVDQEEVGRLSDLRQALGRDREDKQVSITIVRDRREETVTVELEDPKAPGPRRLTELEWLGIEPDEVIFLSDEMESQSEQMQEMQREMQERQREVQKRQQEWRQQWQQQERDLRRQMERLQRDLKAIAVI